MKNIITVTLLLLTLAVCPRPGYSQYGTVKIEGKVVGRDGKPMANTVITIDRKDVSSHYELKTDKNGAFFYGGLDKGVYRIAVMENGVAVAAVDNVTLRLDDRHTQDFDLASRTKTPALRTPPPSTRRKGTPRIGRTPKRRVLSMQGWRR